MTGAIGLIKPWIFKAVPIICFSSKLYRAVWDMDAEGMWNEQYKGIDDWKLRECFGNRKISVEKQLLSRYNV